MSDGFVARFAARHDIAAPVLRQAFAPASGFVATGPVRAPKSFSPHAPAPGPAPKHFSPADRDANPTQGWQVHVNAETRSQ